MDKDVEREVSDWWRTSVIDMAPGKISYRGYEIQELIGRVGFAQMIWLMLRGELPTKARSDLLEAALMAGVDHGPQAPSIAIARMAATCGVGLNNAMASALNVLGDVHGGAGEQALAIYETALKAHRDGASIEAAAAHALDKFAAEGGRYVPGLGIAFTELTRGRRVCCNSSTRQQQKVRLEASSRSPRGQSQPRSSGGREELSH